MCTTRAKKKAIHVELFALLARAEHMLPDKLNPISDIHRYQDRSLSILFDEQTYQFACLQSEMVQAIRQRFWIEGYREFNTGTLQSFFEGGLAQPFLTEARANGRSYALSLTSELKLKRLIIAGMSRVFEITQSFRNEGMDSVHAPEFTLLEAYEVDATCEVMMTRLECALRDAVAILESSLLVTDQGEQQFLAAFQKPFARKTFAELYREFVDALGFDEQSLERLVERSPDVFHLQMPRFTWLMKAVDKFIVPQIVHPTFLTELPSGLSPLVRNETDRPEISRRAFLIINRSDVADVYEDESDVGLITRAMEEQAKINGRPVNQSYLDFLAFGIPPTSGIGMGLNRFFMAFLPLMGLPVHIKETILFPL